MVTGRPKPAYAEPQIRPIDKSKPGVEGPAEEGRKRTVARKTAAKATNAGIPRGPLPFEQGMRSPLKVANAMKPLTAGAVAAASNAVFGDPGTEPRISAGELAAATAAPVSAAPSTQLLERVGELARMLAQMEVRVGDMERNSAAPLEWFWRMEKQVNAFRKATVTLDKTLIENFARLEKELDTQKKLVAALWRALQQTEEVMDMIVSAEPLTAEEAHT